MKGYRKVLIAVNGSKEVLRQGIKLAQDEKTWITVVKVVQPYEGDLNLTGIKNLNDVLDDGGAKAISDINRIAASLNPPTTVPFRISPIVNPVQRATETEST
jgi:hypothetical protein